jgi:hypothetical protein
MTAEELINEIKDVCGDDLQRKITFVDAFNADVFFSDCRCITEHPKLLTIYLHE